MNPDEWPHVDLKPSRDSERYLGPRVEKIDNLVEFSA